ncbi:hypothetical protein T01_9634 [Trichinella spiralis]|uniref:Uncharacterized protein n=1 Tax=Trichinella spiralis TaxID=6334 RepID=A0A0V1AHY4_TRISP|nr:hypothetical protein T01_9634 [Trichinella spiralis]
MKSDIVELSGLKFDSVEVKEIIAEVKPGAELCKFFEKNT